MLFAETVSDQAQVLIILITKAKKRLEKTNICAELKKIQIYLLDIIF